MIISYHANATIEQQIAAARAAGVDLLAAAEKERNQAAAARRDEEIERAAAILRTKGFPEWAMEYADPEQFRINVELPGCSPIRLDRDDYSPHTQWMVAEPIACEWIFTRWIVRLEWIAPAVDTFEAAVAMAAEWGESYDEMTNEAERMNRAGHQPPAPEPAAIDRIAAALETIATHLELLDRLPQ